MAPSETKHSVVDPSDLSPQTLRNLCEEFATRDGTDYGMVERTLEEKVADLERLLARGEASIVFDHETESVTILMTRDL